MTWSDADFADAFVDVGMWVLADVAVAFDGGADYTDVKVSLNGPDRSIFDGDGQTGEWEIEFQTDDLPGLAQGDVFTIHGAAYTVRTTPAVSARSRYFSTCTVQPASVAEPKQSIHAITAA